MKFTLRGYGNEPRLRGTYWINQVYNPPTIGFTDLQEAIEEAERLHRNLVWRHGKDYVVRTYQVQDGFQVLVHEWSNGESTFFNTLGAKMAKFTLGSVPADLDKFWVLGLAGESVGASTNAYDNEQEAREDAAKVFSDNKCQRKVFLLEVIAVIDPIVPRVEWREDLKAKAASS